MNANSAQDSLQLYTSLASIAAITTAIQASVSLFASTRATTIGTRIEAAAPGTHSLNKARDDAAASFGAVVLLGILAGGANGAVLLPWGVISLRRLEFDWVLLSPYWAIVGVSAVLLIWNGVSAVRLWRQRA